MRGRRCRLCRVCSAAGGLRPGGASRARRAVAPCVIARRSVSVRLLPLLFSSSARLRFFSKSRLYVTARLQQGTQSVMELV